MKYKDIYAKWLAEELIKRGHPLKKVLPNRHSPKYSVFVFENTNEINEDIPMITQNKRILQKHTV
ncbi:hypothetical protein [Bacillus mycoides]|uniref:hypothetical protein n=1 Tax=Bacillus mycoides TaxID=1405 RepID=UPI00032D8950|nr:hypothetical protein [Bacillus mycoides]EOO35073.1 hypothetical protein IKK_05144 [Bacillus mycoides]